MFKQQNVYVIKITKGIINKVVIIKVFLSIEYSGVLSFLESLLSYSQGDDPSEQSGMTGI